MTAIRHAGKAPQSRADRWGRLFRLRLPLASELVKAPLPAKSEIWLRSRRAKARRRRPTGANAHLH
jgi:hypothetical protein